MEVYILELCSQYEGSALLGVYAQHSLALSAADALPPSDAEGWFSMCITRSTIGTPPDLLTNHREAWEAYLTDEGALLEWQHSMATIDGHPVVHDQRTAANMNT